MRKSIPRIPSSLHGATMKSHEAERPSSISGVREMDPSALMTEHPCARVILHERDDEISLVSPRHTANCRERIECVAPVSTKR